MTKKLKKKPFLPIGKRRRFPRRRPRSKSPTVFPAKTEKSQDLRKHKAKKDKENEDKGLSNAAQKKARSEIAENQSINIGKTVSLGMKLLLHGNDTDKLVEFNLSVEPETTFKTLKNLIAKTTRIPSDNQLLVIKGQEWKMEEHGRICDDWSTDDLVAIFEVLEPSKGK